MEATIERVSTRGRFLHAVATVSFLYCFLSGVGIAFPKFHWLLGALGGGEFARWFHPWAGVIFAVFALLMFLHWKKDMLLDADDRVWLFGIWNYVTNREELLPETGKYNAGQKMYFWAVVVAGGVVFTLSGIIIWLPQVFPILLVRLSVLVHELMFIAGGAGLLVHIYMGSLAMPGTVSAMISGEVTGPWAKSHHPKWYREKTGK